MANNFRIILIISGAIILSALFLTGALGAYQAGGLAVIALALTAITGNTWRRIWQAFLEYNDLIKMMPHM